MNLRTLAILAAIAMIPLTATPAEISRADEFLAALAAAESGFAFLASISRANPGAK